MESLVAQLVSFPPTPLPPEAEYDKHIKTVLKHLNALTGSKLRGGESGTNFLEVRSSTHLQLRKLTSAGLQSGH